MFQMAESIPLNSATRSANDDPFGYVGCYNLSAGICETVVAGHLLNEQRILAIGQQFQIGEPFGSFAPLETTSMNMERMPDDGRLRNARILAADVTAEADTFAGLFFRTYGSDILQHDCLLDLSALEYVNSERIGCLLKCSNRFKESGGSLTVYSVSPTVGKIFSLMHLDQVLAIAGSFDEAKAIAAKSEDA
jgi:anti-anti-sigma factor